MWLAGTTILSCKPVSAWAPDVAVHVRYIQPSWACLTMQYISCCSQLTRMNMLVIIIDISYLLNRQSWMHSTLCLLWKTLIFLTSQNSCWRMVPMVPVTSQAMHMSIIMMRDLSKHSHQFQTHAIIIPDTSNIMYKVECIWLGVDYNSLTTLSPVIKHPQSRNHSTWALIFSHKPVYHKLWNGLNLLKYQKHSQNWLNLTRSHLLHTSQP
jgi:hypothetical protein